jgi:hypothetical protein
VIALLGVGAGLLVGVVMPGSPKAPEDATNDAIGYLVEQRASAPSSDSMEFPYRSPLSGLFFLSAALGGRWLAARLPADMPRTRLELD